MLKGIGASPGLEIGRALKLTEQNVIVEEGCCKDIEAEIEMLDTARDTAKKQLKELREQICKKMSEDKAQIFDAQVLMLEDEGLFGQVKSLIRDEQKNAPWALKKATEVLKALFNNIPDEYLRERVTDLNDIEQRLQAIMLGVERLDLSMLKEKVILVARDLIPSDTIKLDREKIIAFVTESGGRTSHTAILAKTLGIPAVVGVTGLMDSVKNDDVVIVYGESGEIYVNPNNIEIGKFNDDKIELDKIGAKLLLLKDEQSVSKDGFAFETGANIGSPNDINDVIKNGADGIGLFRTEFLFMARQSLPSEEEQYQAYKEVATRMDKKPAIIRTLDIGGDKGLNYIEIEKEENPFMGYRAIRLCLDRRDIFKTQLRALLRAAVIGNIKIMFPMISGMEELLQAKVILEETKEELRREKIAFAENVKIGIMIETPSAAIISDFLAKEVDFFSIGTNDLIQYLTATDRMNPKVAQLYSPYHPAVLKLIKQIIDSAHKSGLWVGMCGEAAGDDKLIPIFMGMGLDEFSMSSSLILKARSVIKKTSVASMKKLLDQVLQITTSKEVEKLLDENLKNILS